MAVRIQTPHHFWKLLTRRETLWRFHTVRRRFAFWICTIIWTKRQQIYCEYVCPSVYQALILAMGFHEKGRSLMKKKQFENALCHLLQADNHFRCVRCVVASSRPRCVGPDESFISKLHPMTCVNVCGAWFPVNVARHCLVPWTTLLSCSWTLCGAIELWRLWPALTMPGSAYKRPRTASCSAMDNNSRDWSWSRCKHASTNRNCACPWTSRQLHFSSMLSG